MIKKGPLCVCVILSEPSNLQQCYHSNLLYWIAFNFNFEHFKVCTTGILTFPLIPLSLSLPSLAIAWAQIFCIRLCVWVCGCVWECVWNMLQFFHLAYHHCIGCVLERCFILLAVYVNTKRQARFFIPHFQSHTH